MYDLRILTECYIDTLLVESIVPPQKGYNHQHNCHKVLDTMQTKLQNVAALGVIDDDKKQKLNNFSLLKPHNQLAIYKHDDEPHYIIIISKAAEDFILKNAERCNIALSDYDLPTDLNELRKITKREKSVRGVQTKFKKLFSTLKQNQHSDFHTLAKWIEQFKATPYDLNANSL